MKKTDQVKAHKDSLGESLAKYRAMADTATQSELRKASDAVKECRKALSACITEGAEPCPDCKVLPHGMEQPKGDSVEYEVGCLACGKSVRGGLLPKHAVEAWNEGVRN